MFTVKRSSKGRNRPSNGPTTPQLPPELIEAIIRNNEDGCSIQDIRTASLVCKAWRSISLPFLFKIAKFSKERHFEQCRNTCDGMPHVVGYVREARFDPGSGNMGGILRGLSTRLSNMEGLNTMDRRDRIDLILSLLRTEAVSEHILPPDILLPVFHRVTAFRWDTRIVGPPETRRPPKGFTPAAVRFLSLFPNVETLHVEGSFGSQKDIYTLLRSFPKTRLLTFSDPIFYHSVYDLGAPPLLPDLEKLHFDDCDRCGMLDWFAEDVLEHSKPLGLREIKFECRAVPFSLEALARLLEIAAPEHLELPPASHFSGDFEDSLFALSPTASLRLRSIAYGVIYLGDNSSPILDLRRIAYMLDSLSGSSVLRSVSLELYSSGPGDIDSLFEQTFDWRSFGRTILRLPSLEQITINFSIRAGLKFNELERSKIEECARARLLDLSDKLVIKWPDLESERREGGKDSRGYEDRQGDEDREGDEDNDDDENSEDEDSEGDEDSQWEAGDENNQ